MFRDLILKNRSYRRFDEQNAVSLDTLKEWVDCARLSASGSNLQSLKYVLSNQPAKNAAIFETLAWAGYLKDWPGPIAGERPSAYIIILGDTRIAKNFGCDHGIAAQSILLAATEKGFGGCMIGSIRRPQLMASLNLPDHFEILLVLALGKPIEQIFLEEVPESGEIKYWRDHQGGHHVPKRALNDIILE